MDRFIPRVITRDQAGLGYNNEGRGDLIGYLAEPNKHEKTCRYRLTVGGNLDNPSRETCTCRLGLWKEATTAQKVVNIIRKTAKRGQRPKTKSASKPKAKPKRKAGK